MKKIILLSFLMLVSAEAYGRQYTVHEGETLFRIAENELGKSSRWKEIADLNRISEPYVIKTGQLLILPDTDSKRSNVSGVVNLETDSSYAREITSIYSNVNVPQDKVKTNTVASIDSVPYVPQDEMQTTAVSISELLKPSYDGYAPQELSELNLEKAVQIALNNAPEVRAALANIESVKGYVGQAWSTALPQINATADIKRNETYRSYSIFSTDASTVRSAGVTVTQPIWSFGRISHSLEAARQEEAAALTQLADAKLNLRFRVESSFLKYLLAKEKLEVAKEAYLVAERLLKRAKVREAVGAGTRFDVTRSEAEDASASARLVAARAELDVSREELTSAMGFSSSTWIEPQGNILIDFSNLLPVSAQSTEKIAEEERPDLITLRHKIKSSEELISYERSKSYPSIDAIGNFNYSYSDFSFENSGSSNFYTGHENVTGFAGVTVSIPIFDGFRARETVRSRRAATDALKAQYDRSKLDAIKEVRRIYMALSAALSAIAARKEGVRSAGEALQMAEVSFEAGRATSLDVIQASLALTDARTSEAEVEYQFRLGLAQLVKASGTDFVLKGGKTE